jgi:hypothetical protein
MRQLVESILAMSVELSEDGNTGSHLWVTLRLSASVLLKNVFGFRKHTTVHFQFLYCYKKKVYVADVYYTSRKQNQDAG